MGLDAIITIFIILIAILLFVTEYLTIDLVGLLLIVALVISGVISPAQGVKGFANNATITVAAMFVLSASLIKTGVIESVAPKLSQLIRRGYKRSIAIMMLAVGGISAFINNTPVVATLIPIVSNAAQKAKQKPSKYLIPLSFGAIFGGTCTLIGTSTNLLVSGIAEENGLSPFSLFLMVPFGLVIFAVGVLYMLTIGYRLIPFKKTGAPFADSYEMTDYLTEVEIISGSAMVGESLRNALLSDDLDIDVLQIRRNGDLLDKPMEDTILQENDCLLVQGDIHHIKSVMKREEIRLVTEFQNISFHEEEIILIEVVVLNNSALEGQSLNEFNFSEKYSANVLALRQRGKLKHNRLGDIKLQAGDMVLLQTNQAGYDQLRQLESERKAPFISINETAIKGIDQRNLFIVSATMLGIVLLASLNILSIMIAAIAGIVILNLAGVINMKDAYKAIDWKVIFLLAGALSLGTAMKESGLAKHISHFLIHNLGEHYGPIALISGLYLLTSLLTELMSNNASAALLAPIAISIAGTMQVDPVPLLLAITFAGSASFMTPVGYQTNTMIYSAGNYRFSDFIKVGAPLNLLLWIMATFLIPVFYPL